MGTCDLWGVGTRGHILSKHSPSVASTELFKLLARWASAVASISRAPQKAFGPECGEQSWGPCWALPRALGLPWASWGQGAPRTTAPVTRPLLPEPLSSVSSLEVHFDLLDLTELTDMSDQELAEVFADSDDENLTGESPAGLHPLPRAGCLRSPSWTRARAEQNREKQHLGDPERQPAIVDTFLTVERPKEN
uniref:Dysbindin domain-containing protein 1 n=1 Tax=Myotis myotis TaxID=51298 RepID=A0A7J7R545_MYOMY|nr:dysbindin domain containing 1 [Myotis myotis]